MASKNDITGDKIKTKTISEDYRANYEHVFGKREIFYFSDGTWCDRAELPYISASMGTYGDEEVKTAQVPRSTSPEQIDAYVQCLLLSAL